MIKNKKLFTECLKKEKLNLKELSQKTCIPFLMLYLKKHTAEPFELNEIKVISKVLKLKDDEIDEIFFSG